jgi:hypothetical protein
VLMPPQAPGPAARDPRDRGPFAPVLLDRHQACCQVVSCQHRAHVPAGCHGCLTRIADPTRWRCTPLTPVQT